MGKLILTGVDGNLGGQAADYLLELTEPDRLIFTGYDPASLEKYAAKGVETRVADFNNREGLEKAFEGGDVMALVSMPFVGAKRQRAHGNEPITVRYMFEHADDFQVGARHSKSVY